MLSQIEPNMLVAYVRWHCGLTLYRRRQGLGFMPCKASTRNAVVRIRVEYGTRSFLLITVERKTMHGLDVWFSARMVADMLKYTRRNA